MAGRFRVTLNESGMERLLKSDGVLEVLLNEAEPILAEAQRYAPVETGEYKNAIDIQSDETDRAVARVVAHNWKSIIIESRMGVLSRAIGGKRRQIGRDRARERRAERRYEQQIRDEEG